jgi:hypothetical protein
MLSVTNKAIMLSVIMLNAVVLSVVAPVNCVEPFPSIRVPCSNINEVLFVHSCFSTKKKKGEKTRESRVEVGERERESTVEESERVVLKRERERERERETIKKIL